MDNSNTHPCPKCGSVSVEVAVNSAYFSITQFQRDPGILGNKNRTIIRAFACTNCGYIEFYAKEPQKIIPQKPTFR